ncbi:MAG: hypothetical protein WCH39_00525 [Schlesneria sp.]
MSDLLTMDELIERIKEQNGAVITLNDIEWVLRTGGYFRRKVSAHDIPKIMDDLLDAKLVTNTDMKPVESTTADCESQESVVKETRCRAEVIADYVGTSIDDILNECPFWKMAGGDEEPLWFEIRDAIMAKVFDVEHEMGRQELYSEQVIENCS